MTLKIYTYIFKRLFLLAFIFPAFTTNVQAMWAKMSDCELINNSVLIVQAEFVGKAKVQLSNYLTPTEAGVLKVSKVFKGKVELADILIDQPKSSSGVISSSDIIYKKGQKGVWFLAEGKDTDSGIYYANNPQLFWEIQKSKSFPDLINSFKK